MAAQSARPQRSLSTPGTSRRLLIPLARVGSVSPFPRVRSVSPFPLRKDHSEACAFADCFSSGSNFLPNGFVFFFFKEKREYFLPHLYFGMRQAFMIPFVISRPVSLYTMRNCVKMNDSLWRKGFNSPFDPFFLSFLFFLSFRGSSPTLRLTPIPGQHHILPNRRKELKGSD